MSYSAFSKQAFARCLRAGDSNRFGIDLSTDREAQIQKAIDCSLDTTSLHAYESISVAGKPCVHYQDYPTTLVLRALASHIRYRTRIKMPNRDSIVRGVIQVLSDATPMVIFRRDLRSFYESIPLAPLRTLLLESALLGPTATKVLEDFFTVHCGQAVRGVPRGLSISAILAELAMQDFDRTIRTHPCVHRYFRFSDDMLIVAYDLEMNVDPIIQSCLPLGLEMNPEKQATTFFPDEDTSAKFHSFPYLGYSFNVSTDVDRKRARPREISVTIADKKLKKLQSRIILSLKAFQLDANPILLRDRLSYLSSNYAVPRSGMSSHRRKKRVKSGIYFNYHLCRNSSNPDLPRLQDGLKQLDGFMKSLLFSPNSEFQAQVAAQCGGHVGQQLKALSFHKGYEVPMIVRFGLPYLHRIKAAWLHAK